jgi:uncharacterized protein (TIGR00255 family)
MTGYGAADGDTARGTLRVEIRTVNHRFFNFAPKLPAELMPLEGELRERLRREFDRGHVTVHARWFGSAGEGSTLRVDVDHAHAVAAALRELQHTLGLGGELDLALVARQPDVLVRSAQVVEPPGWDEVEPIVAAAAAACRQMRAREGAALVAELLGRVGELEQRAHAIEQLAPTRLERERDRLTASVAQLLDGRTLDDTRLAQELALAADRLDITEELVRLRTHLDAVREALAGDGPVGKRLGFLAQELGREVNTIGSKANDAEIASHVIAMKGELEKLREQLENLE